MSRIPLWELFIDHLYCYFTLFIAVKFVDKNLSGKSDEREVKKRKNQELHPPSYFLLPPSLRFCAAKPKG